MTGKLRSLATLWRNRSLSPDALAALQLRKLRAVVQQARRDVPFYRELYDRAGVAPDVPRTLDDLHQLPIVTKAQLRAAGAHHVVSETLRPSCRVTLHTSGTSGEPLAVPLSPDDARTRNLVEFRGQLALGFRPWDRLVIAGPGYRRRPPLHERLGLFRAVVVPGTDPLDEQVRQITSLQPSLFWCYPFLLPGLLSHPSQPLRHVRPRLLIVSGGILPERDRRMAGEQLGCPIIVSYACMETGRIAMQCREHRDLHVNADHVLLEIMQGDRPAPPGEPGEVVVTALNQFAMPFIRYRLGDVTAWTGATCACGNTHPLIRVPEGRIDEALRFRGGARLEVPRINLVVRALDLVGDFVVVQESLDLVRLQIVPTRAWRAGEREQLVARLREDMPTDVQLDIELVDHIAQRPGKFRQIVSKIAEDDSYAN